MKRSSLRKLIPYMLAASLWATPVLTVTATENVQVEDFDINATEKTVYVSSRSGLNIRSGPGKGYDKIGSLPYGDKVSVTGTTEDSWYQIEYKGGLGYISMQYVSDTPPGSTGTTEESSSSAESPGTESDFDSEITDTESTLDKITGLLDTPIFIILAAAIFAVLILIGCSVYGLFKKETIEEAEDDAYDEGPDTDEVYDDEDTGYDDEDSVYGDEGTGYDDMPDDGTADAYPPETDYLEEDYPEEGYSEEGYPEEDDYDNR